MARNAEGSGGQSSYHEAGSDLTQMNRQGRWIPVLQTVFWLFLKINRKGQTILMVTHSIKAADHGQVLFIKNGTVFHQIYRGGELQERRCIRRSQMH